MKSRSYIAGASALGLVVTAICVLAGYVWFQQLRASNGGSVTRAFEPATLTSQKEMIATYVTKALKIHAEYQAGTLTRPEAKKQALALSVPAVLRDRHLQWILALDAGRDSAIEDMMQEYSTLTLVQ